MLRDISDNQPAPNLWKRPWRRALLTMYACGLIAALFCSVAQADRVLIFRATSTRAPDHYTGEVWAGSEEIGRAHV